MAKLTTDDARVRQTAAAVSDRLWTERAAHLRQWIAVAEAMYPVALPGLMDARSKANQGVLEPVRSTNYVQEQLKKGASGFSVHMTSAARKWFEIASALPAQTSSPQQDGLDKGLEVLTDAVREVFAASGIYAQLDKLYEHLLAFGTGCMLVLPVRRASGYRLVRAVTLRFGTYALGIGADGLVNRVSRRFEFTASQLADSFGLERLPPSLRSEVLSGKGSNTRVEVTCLVEPNHVDGRPDEIATLASLGEEMIYRACYWANWSEQGYELLDVRGVPINPIVAPRLEKEHGDVWGRGRGLDALPGARALAALREDAINIAGNIADPALVVDVSLQGYPLRLERGGITYWPMGDGKSPTAPAVPVPQSLAGLAELQQDIRSEIADTLLVTRFAVIDALKANPGVKTATEVEQLVRENLGLLGPIVTGLDHELLDPLVGAVATLTLQAAQEMGLSLDVLSPVLTQGLKIVYVGEIHQAMKAGNISAITGLTGYIGTLMQVTRSPAVTDSLDADRAIRDFAESVGASKLLLKSPDEVAAIRQARADEHQKMAQLAAMQQVASAAKDGGSAVKSLTEVYGAAPTEGGVS